LIENKKTEYENTIIIGVVNRDQNEAVVKDYLDELSFLSETAGGVVKKDLYRNLIVQTQKHL
jgi:GTP-binding protein HflX